MNGCLVQDCQVCVLEDLADDAIADALRWKRRARKAEKLTAEMLEALRALLAMPVLTAMPDIGHGPVDAARAAIAKAAVSECEEQVQRILGSSDLGDGRAAIAKAAVAK